MLRKKTLSKRKVLIASADPIMPSQDNFTTIIRNPKTFLVEESEHQVWHKSYESEEEYYKELPKFLDCIDYSVLYKKI